jgi:hypothetical protein
LICEKIGSISARAAKNLELFDGIQFVPVVTFIHVKPVAEQTMIALNRYRALLDRFFILAEMENFATGNLHDAVQIKTDSQQIMKCKEKLHLIHQEKLKMFESLQALVLTSGTQQ